MQDARVTHVQLDHLKQHWAAFDCVTSPDFLSRLTATLFGTSQTSISHVGPVERSQFAVARTHTLTVHARSRTLLLPGSAPVDIPVTVTMSLPSSVTIAFDLGHGRRVSLDVHVRPTQYDACSVHYTLHRNVSTFAGVDVLVRCGARLAMRVV